MKYFENIDSHTIVRVNTSSGYDVLEEFKDGLWQTCSPDGSYSREYWLGEGNCTLFEIDEETALDKINSQARAYALTTNTSKMTEKEIRQRLAGRVAEYLMFKDDLE